MPNKLFGCTSEYLGKWLSYQKERKYGSDAGVKYSVYTFTDDPYETAEIREELFHWTNLEPFSTEDLRLKLRYPNPTEEEIADRRVVYEEFVRTNPE